MKDRQYTTKELFRRFQPYFKPYWKTLVLDLFCAGLTTLCELVLPMIMRYITNQGLYHLAELSVQTILGVVAIYLALRVVDCVATYYMAGVGHIMGAKIETDMRRDAYQHLHQLSNTYYNNTKVGQIMGRITNDLFDVTEFASLPGRIFYRRGEARDRIYHPDADQCASDTDYFPDRSDHGCSVHASEF